MDRFYNPFAPVQAPPPNKTNQHRQPHPQPQQQQMFHQRQRFRPPRHPGQNHRPPHQQQQRFPRHQQSAPRGQFTHHSQFRPRQPGYHANNGVQRNGGDDSETAHRPWVTPEHLKMIAERNALYERFQATGNEDNLRLFKIKRFEVNQAINDAKILFLQQQQPQQGHQSQPQHQNAFNSHVPKTSEERRGVGGFHCDPCERKFPTKSALDEHLSEHITCKLDGCTYTAHAKLVMKHIDLQHSTGLFSRIQGHDTPEKIAAWIAERKKNWPTPENLARKVAERSERLERGERLKNTNRGGIGDEEEVFRVRMDRKRKDWRDEDEDNSWKRKRRGNEWQSDGEDDLVNSKSRKNPNQRTDSSPNPLVVLTHFYTDIQLLPPSSKVSGNTRITWSFNSQTQTPLPPSSRLEDEDKETIHSEEDVEEPGQFCITDDEEEDEVLHPQGQEVKGENRVTSTSVSTTVVGLVSYSSCSEEEDDEEDKGEGHHEAAAHDKHTSSSAGEEEAFEIEVPASHRKDDEELSSDGEPPEELPTQSAKEPESSVVEETPRRDDEEEGECSSGGEYNADEDDTGWLERPAVQRLCGYWPSSQSSYLVQRGKKLVRKYTLLQRLLAPDIRRERNIILQACRYIVDNNFFDVPQTETADEGATAGTADEERLPEAS